jgi:hypothetical protein
MNSTGNSPTAALSLSKDPYSLALGRGARRPSVASKFTSSSEAAAQKKLEQLKLNSEAESPIRSPGGMMGSGVQHQQPISPAESGTTFNFSPTKTSFGRGGVPDPNNAYASVGKADQFYNFTNNHQYKEPSVSHESSSSISRALIPAEKDWDTASYAPTAYSGNALTLTNNQTSPKTEQKPLPEVKSTTVMYEVSTMKSTGNPRPAPQKRGSISSIGSSKKLGKRPVITVPSSQKRRVAMAAKQTTTIEIQVKKDNSQKSKEKVFSFLLA